MYVATGCDHVSYFRNIGKAFFLNVLAQHATFITSGDPYGTLADFQTDEGFLAFVRLVGSSYFKKHVSAFKATTPESLYKSTEAMTPTSQHEKWLTQENINKIEGHIAYLMKGCKCKTGCTTRRCRCKKGNLHCGPSCQCINCQHR